MKSKETLRLTAASLLLAVSLLIPSVLGGAVYLPIGPFTATPASHVPTFLAMLLGPAMAGAVGFGSAVGFSNWAGCSDTGCDAHPVGVLCMASRDAFHFHWHSLPLHPFTRVWRLW